MKSLRFLSMKEIQTKHFLPVLLLFFLTPLLTFGQKTVSGTIISSEGESLPGANILIKQTTTGTVSDADGNYQLEVPEDAVLTFSYIGFLTQEINVEGRSTINVSMQLDEEQLEEVVVVGYGTVKKSDLTGAVSIVKADDLSLSVNTSVEQALIGKAAGLSITQNSAQPGGAVSVLIRGAANVGGSNDPLYVIDGFPVTGGVEPLKDPARFGNAGSRSPLNDLNPNDILSIEILKDASATAIYGARAANGVIIITTKRGQEGVPKIEYSGNFTTQKISKWLDLPNAEEFMTLRNQLFEEDGKDLPYTDAEINNAGEGTDWFDQISRDGFVQQHNLSISGGTDWTKYFVSMNYYDQKGVIENSEFLAETCIQDHR